MPIDVKYDAAKEHLLVRISGKVTFADLLAHIDEEERSGHLGAPEVFDARTATTNLTPIQVRQLVERMRQHARQGPLGPTAFVTTNELVFGMARMYSILCDDFDPRFRVCRDLEAAMRWLDNGAPEADDGA